jgi:hypothetical protein
MKTTSKTKKFNQNEGQLNWQEIMNEAKGFKYVVMHRDHYRGNGKGEWFEAKEFAALFEKQGFWFFNCERPVYEVILTDDDVPAIIEQRKQIIKDLQLVERDIHYTNIPMRPNCDGRATRRTQPEAFAEWDKAKAKATRKLKQLRNRRDSLQAQLDAVQPTYSTTLYHITMG